MSAVAIEGAFLAASCWLADVDHLQGRNEDARGLLERIAATPDDSGILAVEASPTGEMRGNIPQPLLHAASVDPTMRVAGQRSRAGPGRS